MKGCGHGRRTRLALVTALACVLAVGMLVPGPVIAGDSATYLSLQPEEVDVESGGTVTLDFRVNELVDSAGDGIDELSATITYDPDIFEVVDAEHGPMLTRGDDPDAEVEGEIEIDESAGTITISQERTPSGSGARGFDSAATITLSVVENVGPASERIGLVNTSAMHVSGHPQATHTSDATVSIDGGVDESDDDGDDRPDGVTFADDAFADDGSSDSASNSADQAASDGTDSADGAGSHDDDSTDETDANAESVPGFGALTAFAALVTIAVVAVRLGGRRSE